MSPYQILGISRWDGNDRIKMAYHNLVKMHHPDRGGDGKHIVAINQAYNFLKKRRGL